jgi:hypothetical protein
MLTTLLKRVFGKASQIVPPCTPEHQIGRRHGIVFNNLGGMGDCLLCLRCGLESYDDFNVMFITWEEMRPASKADWPAITVARNLPNGINNK